MAGALYLQPRMRATTVARFEVVRHSIDPRSKGGGADPSPERAPRQP